MGGQRPKRMHPSGRLVFRHNVRTPRAEELPLVIAEDERVPWSALVPADARDVEIEIGSGKGSFLVCAAESRPEQHFVGIEAGIAYAEYCADRIARAGLSNARMLADDARLFLAESVPDHALLRLHVYYPDPWPKRKHRKRRIFDLDFATLAARVLRPEGELLVATDNTRYFGECLLALGQSPLLWRDPAQEARYGEEVPGLAFGPTNFSEKYIKEDRARHRAVFRPRAASAAVDR